MTRPLSRRPNKPREGAAPFVPVSDYQKWLHPALSRRGLSVADLARAVNRDYNAIYKIARGVPGVNRTQEKPGYEVAFDIGGVLGDVQGSISAAGYPVPSASVNVAPGETVVLIRPDGERREMTITEADISRLWLESDIAQSQKKRG